MLIETTRTCTGPCGRTRTLDRFGTFRSRGRKSHRSTCKDCRAEWAKVHRAKPEVARADKDRRLRRQYGITIEQYEHLLDAQDDTCAICHEEPTGVLAVDHDHETLKPRGLLCDSCNQGLGRFGDSPDRLREAASYLESHAH